MIHKFLLALTPLLLLAACIPQETPPTATPDPTPIVETPAATDTPEPEPTPEPTPEPEPTPTAAAEGPPPTDAALSLYAEAEDRDAYLLINLAEMTAFQEAYAAALADDAGWLQDPYAVAALFIDATRRFSDEPFPYEESFYLPAPPDEAVIIVILGDFKDDSVWGHKIRLELSRQEEVWELDWAGEQWRCRRGEAELMDTWHTTLCP